MKARTQEILEEARSAWAEGLLYAPVAEADIKAANRRVLAGSLVMPYRGMYAEATSWGQSDWRKNMRRIIKSFSQQRADRVLCLHSAAFMHGLWVPKAEVESRIHVVGSNGHGSRWVACHCIRDAQPCSKEGLLLTSLERTAFDCIANLGFRFGLGVADSYLRITGVTAEEAFCRLREQFGGRPGFARIRAAFEHADARSENGGESYARAVMVENHVMPPELQVEIPNPENPAHSYRTDYFWEIKPQPAGGELDGFEKMWNPEMLGGRTTYQMLRDERMRESLVTATGIRIVRFTYDMAVRTTPLLRRLDAFGIPRIS